MWVTSGKACMEHQHLVSGSVGMGYGCWPKGGRRSKWLRLWRESLIPLETGWPTFAEPGPKVWSLNRLGVPPVLSRGEQNQLKSAVQNPPGEAGIELSNWNWKVVRQFLKRSFDLGLSRSSCLNYLHRLGFVLKRPKKHLLKAKDEERKAFVLQYSQIREEAQESGAKIFFVDQAHFRADADIGCRMGGKWVLRGQPALVDSTSPRWGEKANYYSGVCLETGEVEAMEIAGNSTAETSTAFLRQLREKHPGPLVVIWDNGPAHRGEAIRSYLATPDLQLRLVALPAYSPDFNADEAVWDWAREEVTAN